ncbi:YdeI/OmpD-associated family protein [Catenulispora pinisilvae]|uniref:YdeI/OmpD-associated family protein n=1 Tax=Catenulispora pinisilvae TaxID=2705253 RepID=UPI002B273657|nr:YdeI/OmpD-associated family protein [Catenulispora pinisilvae]
MQVTLAPDTEERRVEIPAELATAFDAHPGTKAAFEALSFTRQREHAQAVTSAKQEATRERRIAKIIAELTGLAELAER